MVGLPIIGVASEMQRCCKRLSNALAEVGVDAILSVRLARNPCSNQFRIRPAPRAGVNRIRLLCNRAETWLSWRVVSAHSVASHRL